MLILALVIPTGLFVSEGCSKLSARINDDRTETRAASTTTPNSPLTPDPPPTAQSPEDKMPRVTADEAKRLVAAGEAILIDVRSPEAYQTEHAKDALSIPLARIEGGNYAGLPKNKKIIAYCT
ncbi:MAG: rhodanese-like domain-containing protein [Deltaproteobacteria bacterium]|nr:rhodanese-like domain-containing protein [Deltaproteobacteria bacterium]